MSETAPIAAPAWRQGTSDPDEFQLPMSGLWADIELGRGSVRLPDEFERGDSLAKLQILRDWQRALQRCRNDAMAQFARELCSGRTHMNALEQLELLRATCASLRIELPAGFAAVPAEP